MPRAPTVERMSSRSSDDRVDTVVLDLDGTLVDSVYVHTLAWQAAFRDVGLVVPAHRVHRAIGMGGDRLVTAVAGQQVEDAVGDDIRSLHAEHLDRLFHSITPTPGADDLLQTLREAGLQVVLATSGDHDLTDRLLGILEDTSHLTLSVTGSEVDVSKPDGKILEVALGSVDATRSVVVGDAVWDVRAAADAGLPCIGLLTGGISEHELLSCGAVAVHDDPGALAEHLRLHGSVL